MSLVRGLPGGVTAQTIFDQVLCGLRQQGIFSVDLDGKCRFRGQHGAACSVGWLISDKDYVEELEEDFRIPDLLKALGSRYRRRYSPHVELLTALRHAHDQASGPVRTMRVRPYPESPEVVRAMTQWEGSMEQLARNFGIIYTPPERRISELEVARRAGGDHGPD